MAHSYANNQTNSTHRTVMITELTNDIQDDETLKRKFQCLFGYDEVFHAFVSRNIPHLRELIEKREELIQKLSSSVAYREKTGKTPTISPSHMPCGKERVDAIDLYQKEIDKLDSQIAELQLNLETNFQSKDVLNE